MKYAFAGLEDDGDDGGDDDDDDDDGHGHGDGDGVECDTEGVADCQQEGSFSEDDDIISDDLDDDAEDIVFDNSESDMSLAGSDEELDPRNKKEQRMVCICSKNLT